MNFEEISGNVLKRTRNKRLDLGSDPDHCLDHLDSGLAEVCASRMLLF